MYNVIIGYNNFSEGLIQYLSKNENTIFIIDKKDKQDISIHCNKVIYNKLDITNIDTVVSYVNKHTIDNVYVWTEDDCLNLVLGENISKVKNTIVLFNSYIMKKLTNYQYKPVHLCEIIKDYLEGENLLCIS